MLIIPLVSDLPFYTFQVELDGATFQAEVQWNFRDEGWYASLFTADGDPIWTGLRLVLGFPLGSRCRDDRKPPGIFSLQDTSGADREATFSDLGSRVRLYYFPTGEL